MIKFASLLEMREKQKIYFENSRLKEQVLCRDHQISLQEKQLLSKEEKIQKQEKQIQQQKEQLALKEEQLERKQERILYLERQLYGRSSEKKLPDIKQAQRSVFDPKKGNPEFEKETSKITPLAEDIQKKAKKRSAKAKKTRAKRGHHTLPEELERRVTVVEPEGIDLTKMVKIGVDVREILRHEPIKFYVERIEIPIYKAIEEVKGALSTTIYQASKKEEILPGCMVGESILSDIIIDKFRYHIPEYRQTKRFEDMGIHLSTSSINRWVHDIADKLYPLYYTEMQHVLSSDYVQVDETVVKIADRPGSVRKGYLWAIRSVLRPGLFFYYEMGSRSQKVVLKLFKDYQGALQTDGYRAYSIFEEKKGVLPLGCMAHVRRKFENAQANFPIAGQALDYISLLYMLEANLEAEHASEEMIVKERKEKAYPILCEMEEWMKRTCVKCTPGSSLGKAIRYAFGMWPRISRYCKEGYFKIDNNGIENAIRPITLGRKNYLFSGNDKGAENNAIFYTLIGSCLQAGISPQKWMSDTLKKIPTLKTPINWEELLPGYKEKPSK